MFKKVDHIAIVVRDTDAALRFYRDTLKLPLILSEEPPGTGVRLTHLDMGNLQLQLVQPLADDHPLQEHLRPARRDASPLNLSRLGGSPCPST